MILIIKALKRRNCVADSDIISIGQFQKAIDIYDAILVENPSYIQALKRKVS